jgi:hypothetical protein
MGDPLIIGGEKPGRLGVSGPYLANRLPNAPERKEEAVLFLLPLKKAYSLLSGIKGVLAKTADGADPIFGNVLPDCAGGYTVVGVAQGGVIDIAAGALVFHGNVSSYLPK